MEEESDGEDAPVGQPSSKSAPSQGPRPAGKAAARRAERLASAASGAGVPSFCRARHFVRSSNVYIVPVWDLPANARSWLPDELQGSTASSASNAPPADSHQSAEDAAEGDAPASKAAGQRAESDSDAEGSAGSDSEQSEVGWDGPLGAETRNWSRAAVDGGLVLIRRMPPAKPRAAASTPAVEDAGEQNNEQAGYGLAVSAALFPQDSLRSGSDLQLDRRLAQVLKNRAPKWAVLTLRSGDFAGAVFTANDPICHKAIHRYTIRAKSGGSQAAMDSTGKKPKSAGAQLRRHGEQRLREEIQELLTKKWIAELAACELVFVSVSPRMRATLLGSEGSYYVPPSKVRRLPFMTGKPTFESVKEAYLKVAGVIFAEEAVSDELAAPFRLAVEKAEKLASQPEEAPKAAPVKQQQPAAAPKYSESEDPLHTELHQAAAADDEDRILDLLDDGADPTLRDGKGRVPYYLCTAQKAREAFRRWRGEHEDDWDWKLAQVPEALTEEVEQRRKDKEKEKRRKQKERQKNSKAKAREEEEEQKRKEAEEVKALEAAQAKCDMCKKPLVSKPFSRLEYFYCSTECVNAHRRELQAEAAMKRLGGT
mmetsp:Transcript_20134/g.36440  ORF Transcript_20134/g.36440 Transcript_20134/m.36440 type:complete len:596 (+) Transcript_20134:53-1840(+)